MSKLFGIPPMTLQDCVKELGKDELTSEALIEARELMKRPRHSSAQILAHVGAASQGWPFEVPATGASRTAPPSARS